MSSITVRQHIDRPRSEVFAQLADIGSIHRFSANIEKSPLNAGSAPSGVGAERTCHFYDGNQIQERVVEYVDGQRLVIDIFEGSMPLRSAVAAFELRDVGEGTEVAMTMDYALKYGLIGKAMDALMVRRQFTANLTGLLAGLEVHMRTGDVLGKDYFKAGAAA
jgi:hypothetical protein